MPGQRRDVIDRGETEDGKHVLLVHFVAAERNNLVEHGLGIAHATFGRARDDLGCRRVELHLFQFGDGQQMVGRHVIADGLEVEALAAADDRGRKFVRLGRGEEEFHVGRRLLEGFEQGVEGRTAQHVNLVDQVDAELASCRQEADVLAQLADLLDAIVARAVDLEDIETDPGGNFAAGIALSARCLGRPVDAIERFGENTCRRGFAHAAWSDKEISVSQSSVFDRVAQRAHHGILAENLLEQLRTVFAGENLVTHGRNLIQAPTRCGGINAGSGVFR